MIGSKYRQREREKKNQISEYRGNENWEGKEINNQRGNKIQRLRNREFP